MNFSFIQLYAEVGASFDRIDGPLLKGLAEQLNALDRRIEPLTATFSGEEFKLLITISAKASSNILEIVGPTYWPKKKTVGFSLFLPWRTTSSFDDEIGYVLPLIAEGIRNILGRYGTSEEGVVAAVDRIIAAAQAESSKFRYGTKTKGEA